MRSEEIESVEIRDNDELIGNAPYAQKDPSVNPSLATLSSSQTSQDLSQKESLNSQETPLSLSQGTAASLHNELSITDEVPSQKSHAQETNRTAMADYATAPGQLEATVQQRAATPPTRNQSFVAVNNNPSDRQYAIPQLPKHVATGIPSFRLDTTAGQKRTASGQVKTPTSSTSPSETPIDGDNQSGHISPETSPQRSPNRSPQIGQLTAQLRTRLTYAMAKVQKGWESKNIAEVEHLASRQAKPILSSTAGHAPVSSTGKGSSPSRTRFARPLLRTQPSPRKGALPIIRNQSPSDVSSSSSSYSEMPTVSRGNAANANLSRNHRPTLAPAVDLSPRNPRRSNPSTFQAPKLNSGGATATTNFVESSVATLDRSMIAATPPSISRPLIQTPTQQQASAMEQDAIETLMFMSSPGNSQYRPPNQSMLSGSPLRSVLSPGKRAKARTLELDKAIRMPNDDAIPISPRKRKFLDGANLETDQKIDQVLDRMPVDDSSSSSSDDDDMHIDATVT